MPETAAEKNVRYVKGIGPQRAEALARIGIETVEDLLYHFPRDYQDRRDIRPIYTLQPGETATAAGAVVNARERRPRRSRVRSIFEVTLRDHTGMINLVWFNQGYLVEKIIPGQTLLVYGKVVRRQSRTQMQTPEWHVLGEEDADDLPPIVPVYPLTEGIHQLTLRSCLARALDTELPTLAEFLPADIRSGRNLMSRHEAVRALHQPPPENPWETLQEARRSIAFEEFFLFEFRLAIRKKVRQQKPKTRELAEIVRPGLREEFLRRLPFSLTGAQERVIAELGSDLERTVAMERLLQGDVGSGKTVVILWALLWAVEHGLDGALMAPTEILAEQHYRTAKQFLKDMDIPVRLLTGSTKNGEAGGLFAQKGGIVVGTHALFQERAEYRELGAAVIDEQHKFGVAQRERLLAKGDHPHLLITSATPIPRTLALTVYGDLDVSTIDEMPPGRKPIVTRWTTWEKSKEVYRFLDDMLKKGRQLYIVCPLVEESEKLPHLAAAEDRYPVFKDVIFPDHPVGLIHGRSGSAEKEEVMTAFERGEIRVLVATTVIEVGIDVPNASLLLVENAERFGLSQLHQLRGRIGRGADKSYCILMTAKQIPEVAERRMGVMESTTDGFRVAEEDLAIRGPGELLGTKQSGGLNFRLADIIRDGQVLVEARDEAFQLLQSNPKLEGDDLQPLRSALKQRKFWTA
jgi:ATP-dependent DNA helicase RecG